MSWANVLGRLKTRLTEEFPTAKVVGSFPSHVTSSPTLCVLFRGAIVIQPGAQARQATYVGMQYQAEIVALIAWVDDSETAEQTLATFVDDLPAAFSINEKDADNHVLATLGGTVNIVRITSIESGQDRGFATIADVPYRSATWQLQITDKGQST